MSPPESLPVLSLVLLLVLAGCLGSLGDVGDETPGSLEQVWLSDTERDIKGNHHAVAAARIDGRPMVFAPLSGHAHSTATAADGHRHSHARGCALVGIDGTDGEVRWRNPIPEADCTIHSVADPVVADVDGDGDREVVAATTEERVSVYDPTTGAVTSSARLSAYGFSRPLVGDFLADESRNGSGGSTDAVGAREIVVVDVRGNVAVLSGTEPRWRHQLGGDVQAQPQAAALDADPQRELVVGTISGSVVALDPGEGVVWNRTLPDRSVTWLTAGQADADPETEVAAATYEGEVIVLDDDGEVLWRRDVGKLASVHAFVDGDGDGRAELYAVDKNGTVTAFGADGEEEWRRDVVEGEAQMTPPPVAGDLTGDGSLELVVATNAGGVRVLDPATGDLLATYSRDVPIWTHPTLADLDGDGDAEILVTYGDGRVARLAYHPPDEG